MRHSLLHDEYFFLISFPHQLYVESLKADDVIIAIQVILLDGPHEILL
jgi:hypothetical protein